MNGSLKAVTAAFPGRELTAAQEPASNNAPRSTSRPVPRRQGGGGGGTRVTLPEPATGPSETESCPVGSRPSWTADGGGGGGAGSDCNFPA